MAFGLSAGAALAIGAVAAPVIGGMISGNAAENAAGTQAAATDRSNELLDRQRTQTRTDLAPWRASGQSANNKLMQMLGLSTPATAQGYDKNDPANFDSAAYMAANPDVADPSRWNQGAFAHWQQYGQNEGRAYTPSANALQAASTAAVTPDTSAPSYGSLLKPFTGADVANEPGYQFGLQQGQQGIDRRAQAGGSYFSGAALKGAARFGNDYASTKYGDAFNRDASTKRQQYDFLSGASSSGQNAATMTANAGTQMAGQIGANTTAMGNAMGASQIAQGNALSGAVTGAVNGYQQNQLMNAILGGNRGFGGGTEAWRTTGNGYGE